MLSKKNMLLFQGLIFGWSISNLGYRKNCFTSPPKRSTHQALLRNSFKHRILFSDMWNNHLSTQTQPTHLLAPSPTCPDSCLSCGVGGLPHCWVSRGLKPRVARFGRWLCRVDRLGTVDANCQLAERSVGHQRFNEKFARNLHVITNDQNCLRNAHCSRWKARKPSRHLPRYWNAMHTETLKTTKNMMICDGVYPFQKIPSTCHPLDMQRTGLTDIMVRQPEVRSILWKYIPTKHQLLGALRLHIHSSKTRAVQGACQLLMSTFFGMAIWSQKQLQFKRPL